MAPLSEAFIVVDPVDGKMRLFTNEDNARRNAFHYLFKLTNYGDQKVTLENVTWP
ncbi:hypothetical protein FHT44_005147 [Mycolicibacterium sp. BK634]|uniref:hypothetical protein n=1 Tax=Mycolicibacterium sp. BK634 TaxID=2587099 RepID=UPI00161D881F|nr:hypothetical protein [Mycolicibacterium sp. BK634]MBB3752635.1 hypothetical protein [Mycolicibacterium sp. BK634]